MDPKHREGRGGGNDCVLFRITHSSQVILNVHEHPAAATQWKYMLMDVAG